MKIKIVIFFALVSLAPSCGSDKSPQATDGGSQNTTGADHIVTGGVAYTEAKEESNSLSTSPEDTGYTLDGTGLIITGTFETTNITNDYFSFQSGTATSAKLRVFVNGSPTAATTKIQCTGFSATPSIGGAHKEAKLSVSAGKSCNIILYKDTAEAGATFSVELIAAAD